MQGPASVVRWDMVATARKRAVPRAGAAALLAACGAAGGAAEPTVHRSEATGTAIIDVAVADDSTCVCLVNGIVTCWSGVGDSHGVTSVPLPDVAACGSVTIAGGTVCATDAGRVQCFTFDWTRGGAVEPMSVDGLRDVPETAEDIVASGTVLWIAAGPNGLWTGEVVGSRRFRTIYGFRDPVRVDHGAATCALERDGLVLCTGWNRHGQLGDGGRLDAPFAVPVAEVGRGSSIAAGTFFGCAVAEGEVRCWGSVGTGLGRGVPRTDVAEPPAETDPVELAGSTRPPITDAVAVGGAERNACAVNDLGNVLCWGGPRDAEVGYAPRLVGTLAGAIGVEVGVTRVCAWGSRDVACWALTPSNFGIPEGARRFGDEPE
jgi:hypothetical protein